MRGRLATLLRLLFAVGVTAYLLREADPSAVGSALARVAWSWLVGATGLVLLDRTLMAYRWMALLGTEGRPPFRRVLRIFFESSFIGSFLPGSVGGDAARAWSLSRDGVSGSRSVASVLMDRLLGVIAILGSAIVGLALVPSALDDRAVRWSVALASIGCALALAVVFSRRVDRWARQLLPPRAAGHPIESLRRLLGALQDYRARTSVLVSVMAASGAVQLLRVAQAWMLGRGLGLTVPFEVYLAYIPIILLVMLLPITVSGLGTGNAAFVWLFAQAGVAAPDAFALSILFLALGLVGNLPGGLLYVFAPRRAPA